MAHMTNVASISEKAKAKDPTNVRIGKNVRYIMGVREVNQVQLALELGLTESQVSRRITGSVDWTPSDIEKTARLLTVEIGRVFTLELPDMDSNHEPTHFKSALTVVDLSAERAHRKERGLKLTAHGDKAGQVRHVDFAQRA